MSGLHATYTLVMWKRGCNWVAALEAAHPNPANLGQYQQDVARLRGEIEQKLATTARLSLAIESVGGLRRNREQKCLVPEAGEADCLDIALPKLHASELHSMS